MLKCGITGSTGVLGSKIIKNLKYKFYPFKGNINSKRKVDEWLNKRHYDIIIHLAAIVPTAEVEKNYNLAKKVNYYGTKNLVDSINKLEKKPSWFFFASTSHVYRVKRKNNKINELSKLNPTSKYGKTKMLAEKYLLKKFKKNKINYCIGRIFSFTDKKQKKTFFVPRIFSEISNTNKKTINFNVANSYLINLFINDVLTLSLRNKNDFITIDYDEIKTNMGNMSNFLNVSKQDLNKNFFEKPTIAKNTSKYNYDFEKLDHLKKINNKLRQKLRFLNNNTFNFQDIINYDNLSKKLKINI